MPRIRAGMIGLRSSPPPTPDSPGKWEWALLSAILVYGMVLRGWDMGSSPLWVDEAETCINALTILQNGVPGSHYLGMPIFENTFTRLWPESEEYEFKDTSYSDRGLAIYHGWLPLYAVAASFRLAGVEPDEATDVPAVRHSPEEMRRRTLAARTPALLFGAVFLLAVFFVGRELYGQDAGWAAVAAAAVSTSAISFARQARYYSSTLALTALSCWAVCRMWKRGRWRDFVAGGVLFVLLFHTNVISFVALCAAACLLAPFAFHHHRIGAKLGLFAGILAAGILPWMVLTGFVTATSELPSARSLLSLGQVLRYPGERLPFVLLAVSAFAWHFVAWRLRDRMPKRLAQPLAGSRWAFLFVGGWVLIGLLVFVLLVPAASYFYARLTLVLLAPALLFGALLFAAATWAAFPRRMSLAAAVLFVFFLHAAGKTTVWRHFMGPDNPGVFSMIEYLRTLDIRPGTRIYADGGYSLILCFYTGLPIQSVMPVRKSFLDTYQGELLILEAARFEPLGWREIQEFLAAEGTVLSDVDARRTARQFSGNLVREEVTARVARISTPAEEVPRFFASLRHCQLQKTRAKVQEQVDSVGNPMFRGYDIPDFRAMWQVFFFRFANPEARVGANLNYADRIRAATAFVSPAGWVVFHCPALSHLPPPAVYPAPGPGM